MRRRKNSKLNNVEERTPDDKITRRKSLRKLAASSIEKENNSYGGNYQTV